MNSMSFFAARAIRSNKVGEELNLSSLAEMVPALVVALVSVLMLNFML